MRKSLLKQRSIVEDWNLLCDIEIDWDYTPEDGVTVDAVWLLLANRTWVDGKPVNTIDRINISDYGVDNQEILDHIWENYIYV